MGDLYTVLKSLCDECKISGYKMCKDCGIQPSIMTDLKMGRRSGLKAETAAKISNYFGVTVDYLLTGEQKEKPAAKSSEPTDEDIKFALFNGGQITDAQYEEVKKFAQYVKERDARDGK